jgi:hypothetical protein
MIPSTETSRALHHKVANPNSSAIVATEARVELPRTGAIDVARGDRVAVEKNKIGTVSGLTTGWQSRVHRIPDGIARKLKN